MNLCCPKEISVGEVTVLLVNCATAELQLTIQVRRWNCFLCLKEVHNTSSAVHSAL